MTVNNYENDNAFAEQSVIGSLMKLQTPDSKLLIKTMSMLKPSSFYDRKHQQIFLAIQTLFKKNENIDLLTVENQCKTLGEYSNSLFVYLAEITKATPSAENIVAYSKIVRESAIERFANQKLNELIGTFNDKSEGDVYQRLGLLESTIREISSIGMANEKGGLKHVSEALGKWVDNMEQVRNDGYDKNAFSTGIESLDDVLGRKKLRKGSLVGVGARPKMGKSAFMMLLANHFAIDLKLPVSIFSMEMPDEEIAERSITNRTMVDPNTLVRGYDDTTQGKLDMAFSEIIDSNMFIDDGSALTLSHIQNESRRLRKEKGSLGMICIDYLTLMKAEKAERNDLAYGEITKALKNLAKELECVVLLLTQLNRGLESRVDKRPMPSDSRDTGQIEQDCDVWIGLYKESVYDEDVCEPGLTEVLVRLNRHGGTGTAFVEMRQGFHVPLSTNEGARVLNDRKKSIEDEEQREVKRKTFKSKSQGE